jgi:hypothetical protein
MENTVIKSAWGILEYEDGRWKIIIPSEEAGFTFSPARQYEVKDIELSFNGIECTITGMKTELKMYDEESLECWTEKEIEDAPFQKNEIKYKEKKIWHWFKKSEIKKVPYLDGYVRFKKRIVMKTTTLNWVLFDKRAPVVNPEQTIHDHSGMD